MRSRSGAVILAAAIGVVGVISGCSSLPGNAAASVNGAIITKEDVSQRIDSLRKVYGATIPSEGDPFNNFRRDVADQLVREELERQETEKRGITVSPAEIDQRIQDVADDKFLGDITKMAQEYQAQGITLEDIRTDLSRTILHEKMQAEIGKDIHVTDQDAFDYFQRNQAQYVQPERRQMRQIVTGTEAAAREAARRSRAGEDFIQLVTELSIGPDADAKKGALGLVAAGQLAPELDQAVFRLAAGEVSEPINIGGQWCVLKVENIVPPVNTSFADAKEEVVDLYGGQLYSERWRQFVSGVYDSASLRFDPDYDPKNKVDLDAAAPVQ